MVELGPVCSSVKRVDINSVCRRIKIVDIGLFVASQNVKYRFGFPQVQKD